MYNPILTAIGKAKIADAIANNTTVKINKLAVGDSNGTHYDPTESQIALVHETYRTDISSITINPESPSLVEMVAAIPSNVGGFTIREVAVFDEDGDMIAVSDHPDFGKFIISGSANSLEIKFMIAVTNTDAITLIIQEDVYATVEDVNKIEKALKDSEFPNGFPNRVDSEISFDDASRTFTIEPTNDKYSFYVEGKEFTKTSPLNTTIYDIDGLWYIYFNGTGNLVASQTSFFNVPEACFVAYIYWNATQQKAVIVGDERHGLQITKSIHAYLHNFEGARFRSGLVAGDFSIVGDGSNDSDAQFSLTSGSIQDEDIIHNITHSNTPVNNYEQFLTPYVKAPTHYRERINGVWTVTDSTDFAINIKNGIPQYNQKTTDWALTDVPDNNFYAVWIVATNNINEPIISVAGQRVDATLELAEANNKFEDLDFGQTSLLEFKQLYRLIFKYDSSFTNQVKSALRSILDIRGITVRQISGTTTINHNELTGRSEANSHPMSAISGLTEAFNGVVKTTGNQTIAGIKTFSSSPIVPTPTTDYQVATKKYVDDANNINTLPNKPTPVDTDNFAIQEVGGLLKKLSWANLKAALSGGGIFDGDMSLTTNGYIKFPSGMGGLIIQWGKIGLSSGGDTRTVTLPIKYTTNQFVAFASQGISTADGVIMAETSGLSAVRISFAHGTGGTSFNSYWFSVGN